MFRKWMMKLLNRYQTSTAHPFQIHNIWVISSYIINYMWLLVQYSWNRRHPRMANINIFVHFDIDGPLAYLQEQLNSYCIVDVMTSSNGNIFRVTGHLCGDSPLPREFPTQRQVTRSCDSFNLCLNKRLSKPTRGLWFETPSPSLWRHRNALKDIRVLYQCCKNDCEVFFLKQLVFGFVRLHNDLSGIKIQCMTSNDYLFTGYFIYNSF